jgi:anti-sigma regulatory factor (Ser/Thr protein kinase)
VDLESKGAKRVIASPCDFGAKNLVLKGEWSIYSEPRLIDEVIHQVIGFVARTHSADALEKIDLALHEALVNAIVHGSQSDPSKSVQIRLGMSEDGSLLLAVRDTGAGFDPTQVPMPLGKRLTLSHGRGLFIIRELMDEVTFSFENGTEIRMSLRSSTSEVSSMTTLTKA